MTKSRTDGAGRALESEDALGNVTEMDYNENGAAVSVRDPNEVGWDAGTALGTFDGYDARNRLTDRIDTNGDTSSSVYDKNNNVVLTTDAKSQNVVCSFDARDRKYSCVDRVSSDTRLRYDQNSNLTILKDGEDQQTEYMYDERNLKVFSQFPDHVVGQNPGDANYGITTCTYDAAKRKFRYEDQLGDTKTHIYDMADRLKQRDYRLRVNSPSGTIADSDVMTYDDANRVLTAVSGRYSNTVTLTYDDANRKATEKLTILSKNFLVTSTYDAANRRTQIKYPDNSTVARMYTDRDQLEDMHYDSDGAGAGAAIHVEHRVYDNGRRLTQCDQNLTGAGGTAITSTTKTYRGNVGDPGDNLTETINITSTNAGNPLVTSFDYSYDANKNKLKETIGGVMQPYGFGTTVGQEVVYDGEDRVTGWNRDDALKTQAWTLSKVGDWNTFNDTILGNETRVHGATHELSSITGGANPGAITHDAKGNILTSPAHGSQTYVWDFDNQLKQAVIGGTHKYYYDALGRRVMKHVAGENRLIFVHDGPQIIAEYKYTNGVIGIPGGIDAGTSTTSQTTQATQTTQTQDSAVIIGTRRGTATLLRKYVYATYVDERCLFIDKTALGSIGAGTEELFYYHANNLYSVAAMTDAAGLVIERYAYDAYGNIIFLSAAGAPLGTQTSTIGQPYIYTGRRLDDETGLYQYRARYYDAAIGRFISRDPISYVGGHNLYAYANGNPTNDVDPTGLVPSGYGPYNPYTEGWHTPRRQRSKTMKELINDYLNLIDVKSIGASKTIPFGSMPIAGGIVRLTGDVTFAADVNFCCEDGMKVRYFTGSVTVEAYGVAGYSYDKYKHKGKAGRNTPIADPNRRGGLIKRKIAERRMAPATSGFRQRNAHATFGMLLPCPIGLKAGIVDWDVSVFVRGSVGAYVAGYQFNVWQSIGKDFDIVNGWTVDHSVAYGVSGASAEAGIAGIIYLVFHREQTGERCAPSQCVAPGSERGGQIIYGRSVI